jgi:hypothetical protein
VLFRLNKFETLKCSPKQERKSMRSFIQNKVVPIREVKQAIKNSKGQDRSMLSYLAGHFEEEGHIVNSTSNLGFNWIYLPGGRGFAAPEITTSHTYAITLNDLKKSR